MEYIINDNEKITSELGHASFSKKAFTGLFGKVHPYIDCNIDFLDEMKHYHKTLDPKIKVGVSFIPLKGGLEICLHLGLTAYSVGVYKKDVLSWFVKKYVEDHLLLCIITRTNYIESKRPISFIVKDHNLEKVRLFLTKHGYPEYNAL